MCLVMYFGPLSNSENGNGQVAQKMPGSGPGTVDISGAANGDSFPNLTSPGQSVAAS